MDAQRLDLANESVDGVLCRFGLMLMPEPHKAVSESHRVLRPGGHLAYAVFGQYEGNAWITRLADAFAQAGHALSDDIFERDGSFFSLADHEVNRTLLAASGFSDILIEDIAEPRIYDDFDEYWDHHTHATGPIAAVAASLSRDETESVKAVLKPMLEPFRTPSGYQVPALVVVVNATN